MYAIIKAGGKQYKVEPGTTLDIERVDGEPGDTVVLQDSVLMLGNEGDLTVGTPVVSGASVELEIKEQFRTRKVIVFKMKRRKHYRRQHGHRQQRTRVTVKEIKAG